MNREHAAILNDARQHFFNVFAGRARDPMAELRRAANGLRELHAAGAPVEELDLMPELYRLDPDEVPLWRGIADTVRDFALQRETASVAI